MNHADFWRETQALAEAQRGDGILAYMHLMLEKARAKGLELTSTAGASAALRCGCSLGSKAGSSARTPGPKPWASTYGISSSLRATVS